MAIATDWFPVSTDQRVTCSVVVKFDLQPVNRCMTISTVLTHKVLMGIVVDMTRNAIGWCFPVLVSLVVTVGAFDVGVSTDERKVGEVVVERLFVENNDPGIAAFVIGMAVRTIIGSCAVK